MDRSAAGDASGLLRVLGLAFGLAVVIGGAVGQGILRAPGLVAAQVQVPLLILAVWLAGGLLAMLDGFAVAELAAAIPKAGGAYVYVRRAFGAFPATLMGWADFLNGILANAFIAIVFAEYVHRLGVATAVPQGALATALLLVIGALNWTGTRTCGASQNLGTALKAALLLALVVALFLAPRGLATPGAGLAPASGLAALVIALRATAVTYFGWHQGMIFGGEVAEPQRNLPRAVFGGLAIIMAIYLLVNAALLHALPVAALAGSNLPAADAMEAAWGAGGSALMTVLALISVVAIVNLQTMAMPRIAYAMAGDGVLPRVLAAVSPNGTPRPALVVTVAASIAFAVSGSYEQLIAATAVTGQLVLAAIDAAAIRLRRTEPGLERPFRMPLFPLPAALGIAINLALIAALVWEDPGDSLLGVALLALVALAYAVRRGLAAGAAADPA